jgi:hypothetical protein
MFDGMFLMANVFIKGQQNSHSSCHAKHQIDGFFYLNPLSLEHVKRSIAYGKAFILLDSQSEIQAIKRHRIILLTFHWKTRIWM